jgi:hypothetical protein
MPSHARRLRQRRKKNLPRRRRIIFSRSPSGPRSDRAAAPRSDSTADPAARPRSRSRTADNSCCSDGDSRFDHSVRRRNRLGSYERRHDRLRRRRLDGRDDWRRHRERRRIGANAHELQTLVRPSVSASSATSRSLSPSAEHILTVKRRSRKHRRQKKKKDQRVHKDRRDDPFPIFPLFLRQPGGRAITGGYCTSFGGTPMMIAPAPRATSIAHITSP